MRIGVVNLRALTKEGMQHTFALSAESAGRSSTCLYQKLVPPVVQVVKSLLGVHIIHKDAAVGAAVECHAKTLEALLPRCVPDLWDMATRRGFTTVLHREIASIQCNAAKLLHIHASAMSTR